MKSRNDIATNAMGADELPTQRREAAGRDFRLDPDAVMQRVRAEVIRRHAADVSGAPPRSAGSDAGVAGYGEQWNPAAPRLPDKDQYVLGDFLGFDDADFVDVAYRKLLRRPASDPGCEGYLGALRGGAISKVEVLGAIRFSDEGRRQAVHVDGLLVPYKLHSWRRKRVVGWFIGMGMALARLPRLAWHLQHLEASAARENHALGRLLNRRLGVMEIARAQSDAVVGRLQSDLAQFASDQQERIDQQNSVLAALQARMEPHDATLVALLARADAQDSSLATSQTRLDGYEASLAALQSRLDGQNTSFAELRERVLEEQRRLRIMMDRLAVFLDVSAHNRDAHGSDREHAPERQYLAFEDAFRGERAEIKKRAAHYLGTLAAAGIEPNAGEIILDLGSGRGEWLEVLAEHGYRGRGVDLDHGMLAASRERGHDVVEANVLDYLRVQDDDSFAAITAMHLVEHIPHSELIKLLDQALRVLRPGGVLVLETPNPENVRVGSYTFYMDPTHLNPIPPLLLQWVVQARGFEQAIIERLSEYRGDPAILPVPDDVPGAQQINLMIAWFTAPPDYAAIARKPLSS